MSLFDGTLFGCDLKGNQKENHHFGVPSKRHTWVKINRVYMGSGTQIYRHIGPSSEEHWDSRVLHMVC